MRITLLLLGIIYSCSIWAQEISETEAMTIGKDFLSAKKESKSPHTRNSNTEEDFELAYTAEKDGKACFYVYDCESGGFVIVSADTRNVASILGYSSTGHFDYEKLSSSAKYWMDSYKNIRNDKKLKNYLEGRAPLFTNAVEPLLGSTMWGQGEPFNRMCPEVDGQKCVTGCVATAMAQVMYYHKWPEHGNGTVSYISQYGHNLSADLSNSYYEWDLMLPQYNSSQYSEASANAVALLMRDCGYSIQAQYGLNGSGADFHGNSLLKYFNYDKGIRQYSYECYDPAEWDDILKTEIDNGRPVLYGGIVEAGAHALVCDGYDNDGYFHLNFGWNGIADGYYLTSAGYPAPTDIMCGIEKDHGGESVIEFAAVSGLTYKDGTLSVKAVLSNVEKIDVEVAIAYENISTHVIKYIGRFTSNSSDIPNPRYFYFNDGEHIEDGNYIAYPVCRKTTDNSQWHKCHFKNDSQNMLDVTVNKGVKTYSNHGEIDLPEGMVHINGIYYYIDSLSQTAKVTCHEDFKGMYADEIIIPEYIEDKGIKYRVTAIGEDTFNNCEWMSVELPRSIKIIEKNAFRACYLNDLIIPSDSELEEIEDFAFEYCHFAFHELNFPSKLKSIGESVFNMENCNILSIPSSVISIGKGAFRNCKRIKDINVFWDTPVDYSYSIFTDVDASHVKLHVPIGTAAKYRSTRIWSVFNIIEGELIEKDIEIDGLIYTLRAPEMTASLKNGGNFSKHNLILPEIITYDQQEYKLTIIEDASLDGYNYKKISYAFIPNTIEELRNAAFFNQNELLSIDIEGKSSLWLIGGSCFDNCSQLQSINLPMGLKKIDVFAFYNCTSLKTVDIPSTVNEICQDAFQYCISLEDVYVHWNDPLLIHSLAFEDVNYSNIRLHVPRNTKNKYSQLAPWSLCGQIIEDVEPMSNVLVESISLSYNTWTGKEGESIKIESTVLPENASNKSLRWNSSDESIAIVDNTGFVSIKNEGICIITATALDGSKISEKCVVTCGAGIDEMSSDDNLFELYNLSGILLNESCDKDDLKTLSPGVYIIRSAGKVMKIVR